MKCLAEFAGLILNESESNAEIGYEVFDSVLTASLLYARVKFSKKYLYELLQGHAIWKDYSAWNLNMGKVIQD